MAETPRVGIGFDVHRWAEERPLMLGGIRFEGVDGLSGHSDGDAVCHALADALLGAAALGDVGEHFPESDPALEGIAGLDLLARTLALIADAGFEAVIGERPPIAPRRSEMRSTLALALGLPVGAVSVKATRPEGLGLQGDGIGCMAIALLEPIAGAR